MAPLIGSYMLGLAVAAPIGPVNLEIMRRVLRHGPRAGLLVGLGAITVDALYLMSFSTGLAHLEAFAGVRRPMLVVGGLFLLWLGLGAAREALAPPALPSPAADASAPATPPPWWRHVLLGLAMTATNPFTLAFWSAFALQFAPLPLGQRLACCLAMMAGCYSWVLTITTTVTLAHRRIGPRGIALATAAGAACILYFGAKFLWQGVVG